MEDAAARNVGEVAGTCRAEAFPHDLLEEEIEQLLGGPSGLGQRLGEGSRERGSAFIVRGRLARQRFDVVEDASRRGVD